MTFKTLTNLLGLALPLATGATATAQDYVHILTFESSAETGTLTGWAGGPPATLQLDSTVVREGRFAGRISRNSESPSNFSVFTLTVPVEFSGDTLELLGWIKMEGVTGFAGLWLREDGRSGMLHFDNMEDRNLSGTADWTEYRIALPLEPAARRLMVGGILVGEGTLWIDDLKLLVDGRSAAEAPPFVPVVTPVEMDTEFDEGSRIENRELRSEEIEDLVLLGRVWGFLKYHHPRVTGGQLNWDYELFRVISAVLDAADRTSALRTITEWVEGAGEPDRCTDCAGLSADLHLSPEIDWIRDASVLGAELSAYLVSVYENRTANPEQYYVGHARGVGNPDFSSENAYAAVALPDAGFRLLGLFRLWNIIEYWFPYRDILDEDWDDVLAEYIPRLMTVDDADTYRLMMMEVIARIDDTHANLWSSLSVRPPVGEAQLPVVVRFVEGRAVVTGYLHPELGPATGLEVGDVILSINGSTVDALVSAWRQYYAASNQPSCLRDIGRNLTKGSAGVVAVTGRRDGAPLELSAQRAPTDQLDVQGRFGHDRPGDTFQMLTDDVAYLKLSSVEAASTADYIRRASGTDVLVIDIRNYPSEFVVFALGQHLVSARTEFARFTRGDAANPGAFRFSSPVALEPAEPHYSGQVVILVDEVTQSQAEYTTMAFRSAPNTTVVGSTTAGADGNISPIPLPGGLRGMISGIGVFYPDKSPTQRIGILPDLEVRPTIAGIRAGRDEVLEAAVSHALGREWRMPVRR